MATIIKRFERIFGVNIVVLEEALPLQNLPGEHSLVLVLRNNHYNVVYEYSTFIKTLN